MTARESIRRARTARGLTQIDVPGCGMLERTARHRAAVSTFLSPEEIDATLLIAGCDPAAALLADWLAREVSQQCGCDTERMGRVVDRLNTGESAETQELSEC